MDVSKGESHAQAFLDRGVHHGKTFRFNHDLEGLASFLNYMRGVESAAGMRPSIVMEATGHYHSPIVQFLDEHQYLNIVINPLISHNAKKTNLRRLKTDAAEAHLLGSLFYKEEFEPYKKRGQHLMNLRYLTRQHESLTGMYVQAKLLFRLFWIKFFLNIMACLVTFIQRFPFDFWLYTLRLKRFWNWMKGRLLQQSGRLTGRGKTALWCPERAQILVAAARRNHFKETAFPGHLISMQLLIKLLLQYKDHLADLNKSIEALAEALLEYDLIQSIPGICTKIAAE
ncbi:transposase [Paenibacillus sp. V4I7]|uniref:IS110 family transposase n=2 Tax=unclassified Paenibacillus TaxID=185978 RepID=UPI0027845E6E|nr:transposase [Paenibacillus sp. V4I7]MDQ0899155.1 transposase [Paenibacillus sp. V4I7]